MLLKDINSTVLLQLNKNTILKAQGVDKAATGDRYSANDLAQYIFWTGDEAGVALAIEDLIEEGLVSGKKSCPKRKLIPFSP